jgi:hypothetical protein
MTVSFASWRRVSEAYISSQQSKHREHPGAGYTQDSAPFFILKGSMCEEWFPPGLRPEKRGGLNGSVHHLLAVYLQYHLVENHLRIP